LLSDYNIELTLASHKAALQDLGKQKYNTALWLFGQKSSYKSLQIRRMICMPKKPHIPAIAKKVVEQAFSKSATEKYPFVKPELAADFRGQPDFDFSACIGCGLCSRDCPAEAIEMVMVDSKRRPQLNLSKCVFCYQCAESCPKKAIKSTSYYELATTDKSTLVKTPKPNPKT
jgi:formate hydrogenlyase subunit 6/NADH:ubiquinone oxidoreductase subunit I